MSGKSKIKKSAEKVFLDSMCFIYFFEANKSYGAIIKKIFRKIAQKKLIAYTSSLTLAEILAQPRIILNNQLVSKYKTRFLTIPNLTINCDLSIELAEKAAKFKAKYNLRLPDAIQLAVCLLSKSQVFITNDVKMRKVEEFKILLLKDLV